MNVLQCMGHFWICVVGVVGKRCMLDLLILFGSRAQATLHQELSICMA